MQFKNLFIHILVLFTLISNSFCSENKGIKVGTFQQEVRTFYSVKDGLPTDKISAIAISVNGDIYAGTENGLAVFSNNSWRSIKELDGKAILFLAVKLGPIL